MRNFFRKIFYISAPIVALILSGVILPSTPRAKSSLLFSEISKEDQLRNTQTGRLILVGGSNLSFGINSQVLKDSLNLEPVNTGIHAGLGLRYMLNNIFPFIREGDVVLISLEYQHFINEVNHSSPELLRMILDVDYDNIKNINVLQFFKLMSHIPKYSLTKFNPLEYRTMSMKGIYSVKSFNEFGDCNAHWHLKSRKFLRDFEFKEINMNSFQVLNEFVTSITQKGAIALISMPAYQFDSYSQNREVIEKIEIELSKIGDKISNSENYVFHDTLMFNSPYHLTKAGVDLRTNKLVSDISRFLQNGFE